MKQEELREAITLENQGQKIFGILHRPLHSGRVPGVVICPGFAGTKCGKFRMFVTLGKELAKQGIAVFRFDYRGSGDSEGEFSELTIESKISDAEKCLDFLASDPQIDPNRLGLLGRSLGGAIAVLTAGRFSAIKSLALWAPVFKSDPWRELWNSFKSNHSLDLNKQEMLKNLPVNVPNLEFLQQFFKLDIEHELFRLKHIPLLHIHGDQDMVVKIEHAKEYEKARSGLDNTRFIQLPRSNHDFSDPAEQLIAIQETCLWYQKTLLV